MDFKLCMKNFSYIAFGIILLILNSCAQVGEISGGTKDFIAPVIKEIEPPNENLYFTSKRIVIEFDEYIKLNNPIENIIIVPKGIKISTKVDKKKVILDLEGNFEKQTTYHITFNSAIQDITESNDSLMHYVFSTGDKLDTFSYSGIVVDAYSGEKLKNILVGLYQETDTINVSKPLYFAKTDEKGEFKVTYLKEGKFKVYAFHDENKDMIYQVTEKVGFKDSLLRLSDLNPTIFDSTQLLISINSKAKKITSKSYIYPKLIKIAATYPLDETNFTLKTTEKETKIESSSLFYYSTDSISILLPEIPSEDFRIIANSQTKNDTLNFKLLDNKKATTFTEIQPSNKDITKSKSFMILFANQIVAIDSTLITCMDIDSTILSGNITYDKNTLVYKLPDTLNKSISITFNSSSIIFKDTILNEKLKFDFINKSEREFGSLLFKSISLPEYSYVEFILNGKVVLTKTDVSLKEIPLVSLLEPGEYSFRIIKDKNSNLKWDPSSVFERKQAEKVLHFPEKVKVRANWETEIEFDIPQ